MYDSGGRGHSRMLAVLRRAAAIPEGDDPVVVTVGGGGSTFGWCSRPCIAMFSFSFRCFSYFSFRRFPNAFLQAVVSRFC